MVTGREQHPCGLSACPHKDNIHGFGPQNPGFRKSRASWKLFTNFAIASTARPIRFSFLMEHPFFRGHTCEFADINQPEGTFPPLNGITQYCQASR